MGRLVLGKGMASETLAHVRELAAELIPQAFVALREVLHDKDSRQRVAAAKAVCELSVVGLEDAPAFAEAGVTKIVLVNAADMDAVERKQREVVAARVVEERSSSRGRAS